MENEPLLDTPTIVVPEKKRTIKVFIIILCILMLLIAGFALYWFYLRDTEVTEQDKLDILESLKQSSTIDFTPEAKDAILNGLSAQSQIQSSGSTQVSEEEKLRILNSLGQ
ncbi:MAG: hypothetical protein MUD00_00465 [Candidatus Pacebacteria bacterium]|jgi:hypothetical protein|nr:hypothetical protein [Candidatus Paceibacterota bacterium]